MTSAQRELLNSIRGNLWGEVGLPQPSNEVLEEAKVQAIVPIITGGRGASQYTVHLIRILYAQDELVSLLQNANIPMVILKGAAAAVYYAEPMQRTMGDIDLIVPKNEFENAQRLMDNSCYRRECEDAENPDNRHIAYQKDGITIELHRRFSSDGIDIERYVQQGLEQMQEGEIAGHCFPMLPPLENGLVLLAHVAQHLRNGLGLRQMIDWMMYVHAVLTDEYWRASFRPAAADCGLETLAITATRLCQKYLGLPDPITWCDGADDKLTDDLLENLLVTGNFGHTHGPGSSVETVTTNIKRTGLFRYLQKQGEHNWKAYQDHAALRPFCWAYQICRYIRRGFGTGRSGIQLAEDYNRSRARYDLLTRLGID